MHSYHSLFILSMLYTVKFNVIYIALDTLSSDSRALYLRFNVFFRFHTSRNDYETLPISPKALPTSYVPHAKAHIGLPDGVKSVGVGHRHREAPQ